jgi:hypothetical protein
MSYVVDDSDKRIQEINSLKISDAEKARLIRAYMFMKKQTAPVKALTTNSRKNKNRKSPITVRVYQRPVDPFKTQIMSILKQNNENHRQKMDEIQVVVNERRQVKK